MALALANANYFTACQLPVVAGTGRRPSRTHRTHRTLYRATHSLPLGVATAVAESNWQRLSEVS